MSSFLDSTGLSRLVSKITDYFAKKDGTYPDMTVGRVEPRMYNPNCIQLDFSNTSWADFSGSGASSLLQKVFGSNYTGTNTITFIGRNKGLPNDWETNTGISAGPMKWGIVLGFKCTDMWVVDFYINNTYSGAYPSRVVRFGLGSNGIKSIEKFVVSHGASGVGSPSTPVYVESDGSVNACTPANMTAGKTYVFNKANPTSGKYYALLNFTNNTGITVRTYSGCMLSFCTRSNNTQNIKGIIFISPYEWNCTDVVAKTIIFGAYSNVSNKLPVFYVRNAEGNKNNFQLWVNITGPNTYIELSLLNAGAFDVAVMTDSSDERPTNSTVCTAVRNVDVTTESNTSTVVGKGSESIPAYIASDGSLNACTLSLNATYVRTNSSSYDLYATLKPSFICCAILHNATNAASTITIGSGVTTTIQTQTVAVFVWDGTRWYKMPYSN